MAETKQLEGGRVWVKAVKGSVVPDSWDSKDGDFRIVPSVIQKGKVILISFNHECESGEVWHEIYATVEKAMEQAEKM
jgi:hypothetical protein